jgi:hypothetical protein
MPFDPAATSIFAIAEFYGSSKFDAKLLAEIRRAFDVLFENIEINYDGWFIGFVYVKS